MFADTAYAMGGLGGGNETAGGNISFIVMMAALFGIFYFLLILPQQKKQKELKKMLAELTHGDTVMTTGGIQGKVTAMTDTVVTLEIADKVRIKVARSFIGAIVEKVQKQ
jgi:preprotein translocase subunit YajC